MRGRWKTAALVTPFAAGWIALFVAGGAAERLFARLFVGSRYADFTAHEVLVIHPKGEADEARRTIDAFHVFLSRLQAAYPGWKLRRPDHLKVCILLSHDDFRQFGEFETGQSFEFNGGYFSAMKNTIAVIAGANLPVSLRHEGTHALFYQRELPRWANEGLATYFENSTAEKLGRIDSDARDNARRLLRNPGFSLERVLTAGPREFQGPDNTVYYDLSNVLVAFFLDGSDGDLRQKFIDYVGGDPPGVFEDRVLGGLPLEDFQKRLLDFLGD